MSWAAAIAGELSLLRVDEEGAIIRRGETGFQEL